MVIKELKLGCDVVDEILGGVFLKELIVRAHIVRSHIGVMVLIVTPLQVDQFSL